MLLSLNIVLLCRPTTRNILAGFCVIFVHYYRMLDSWHLCYRLD